MNEKQSVKIRIYSRIDNLDDASLPCGDPEITESECDGVLDVCDGALTLTYDEVQDGGVAVACTIACEGGTVRVLRSGAISSELIFEEGKTQKSLYKIPPYAFDMTVRTKRVRGSLTSAEGLSLIYSMEIGGAKKDCRMEISLTALSGGKLL
jgi:uncharacterized beta-barrel protein YwiB (DUF1934 family)